MAGMLDWVFSGNISGLEGHELASVLISLGLLVVTAAMAIYLNKTFRAQINSNTMSMTNKSHEAFLSRHKRVLNNMSRNFLSINKQSYAIKYEKHMLKDYLNELERVCLFTKTRAIRVDVVFGLFLAMIRSCLCDDQIKKVLEGGDYPSIQKIVHWLSMYQSHPIRFKIRYWFHLL